MQPTIISYSRVSSAKQLTGTGIAQQKDAAVLESLSQKHSLPIDKRSFSDEGLSGYHSANLQGEFGRILCLISSGSIVEGSILAITSLDRISRAKTNEAMELMLSVLNRGIRIYTAMDDKLYSSDSQNLTADLIVSVIIMAQAHEESLKKSQRTIGNALTLIRKHEEGIRSSDGNPIAIKSVGKLPWWIDSTDGSIKPDSYYFPIAQTMAQKMVDGVGVHRILNWLNENYKAPSNKPYWSNSMVTRFHKSEALRGLFKLNLDGNEHTLKDYLPRVCSDEEFYIIQSIKKSRIHLRSNKVTSGYGGVGVLKCRLCGGSLTQQVSSKQEAYRCINGMKNRSMCSGLTAPKKM